MSIPEFDVALEVSKLRSPPAIFAIPAIHQGENSKNSRNSSPDLRLVPTSTAKNSKNSKNSSPSPSNGWGKAIPIPTGHGPMGTGLEWVACPPEYDAEKYGGQWAAFDLADLGKLFGVRIVHAGERVLAIYPPTLEPELVAHASKLLAEARKYLAAHMDKLPILTQPEAVKIILDIMAAHTGFRFTRGTDASMWPLYPRTWTAGQKVTVQALWYVAGPALDLYDFREADA